MVHGVRRRRSRGGMGQGGRALGLLLLALLSVAPVQAEDGAGTDASGLGSQGDGLSVQFQLANVQRVQGPLPLAITLQGRSGATRTGSLLLSISDGSREQLRWRSPVWTVTGTPRTVDCLLPPMALVRGDTLQATVAWEEDGQVRPMSPVSLTNGRLSERPLVLGWCGGARSDFGAVRKLLALDGFFATWSDHSWHPDAHVTVAPLSAESAPAEDLGWCGFDAAAFSADGLDRLGQRQLQALGRWVAGGGSLVVVADGERLAAPATTFLQDLGTLAQTSLIDAGGVLDAREPIFAHAGLGRCVILPLALAAAGPSPAAARIAPFLWRVRSGIEHQYVQGVVLDPHALEATAEEHAQNRYTYYRRARAASGSSDAATISFAPDPDEELQEELPQLLMPSGIGTVPFGLVAAIIIAFALAIGPGDWLILGYFRAHRYTWILFPTLSVLCTVLLMAIANRYLGSHEHHTHLIVVDVGAQGRVLRQDTIEEVFSGHAGTVRMQVDHSLWVPLNEVMNYRRGPSADDLVSPVYDGALPVRYTTTSAVQQWSPAMRRSLSFTSSAPPPVTLAAELTDPGQAEELALGLAHAHPGAVVGVVRGKGRLEILVGSPSALHLNPEQGTSGDWLEHLCCAPERGWFALTSQLSPTGGAALEDLPVIDPDDPSRCMLVLAYPSADTIWVVRRIYALPTPAAPAAKDHA